MMIDPVLKYYDEVLLVLLAFGLLSFIGNLIAKKLLSNRGIQSCVPFKNGKMIGNLERSIIFIGILIQEWSLVAVVIALKTIARYRELDDQDKSEYFLIGSLFSMLWAITIALIVFYLIKETIYFEQLKFLVDDKTMNVKIIS